jgi:hypothetical protein
MLDQHAVDHIAAATHRHDRFLGHLLEVVAGHTPTDDDAGLGLLDRQSSEGWMRALLESLQ